MCFRTSRFCCKNQNKKLLNRFLHYNCRVFDWQVDGRNQTERYSGYQVWTVGYVSLKISKWNFVHQDSHSAEETDHFLIDWLVTTPKISIGISMRQIEPKFLEKNEFEFRDKSKFMAPFGNFRPTGLLLKGKKSTSLQPKLLPKIEFFRLRPRWKRTKIYQRKTWFW